MTTREITTVTATGNFPAVNPRVIVLWTALRRALFMAIAAVDEYMGIDTRRERA